MSIYELLTCDSIKGDGVLELTSDVSVADGEWHTVLAKFNPTYMEISVDGATETLRPSTAVGKDGGQGNRHVDLSGLLYFGGIEPGAKRSRAFVQGVEAAAAEDAGLEGCLRDLTLDGRQEWIIFLSHVLVL